MDNTIGYKYSMRISLKSIYIFSIIYVCISLLIDIMHRCGFNPLLTVQTSYLSTLFTGIITIAVISNAILSVIISSLNYRIYGFTLKDIAFFNVDLGILHTVIISFCIVFFSLIAWVFKLYTTITAFFVVTLVLIGYSSLVIWKMLTNSKYEKCIIEQEIIKKKQSKMFLYDSLLTALKQSFIENDKSKQDELLALISLVIKYYDNDDYYVISKRLSNIFPIACENLSFVEAFDKLVKFNGDECKFYPDSLPITKQYFTKITFPEYGTLDVSKIITTFTNILYELDADSSYKITYLYAIFRFLKSNLNNTEIAKSNIYNQIFKIICNIADNENGKVRSKVLLNVFRDYVIRNDNTAERNQIFLALIDNLYSLNLYNRSPNYISTLAQIVRAIYFYSEYEVETLNSDYRAELRKLYTLKVTDIRNETISLQHLVEINSESISTWLGSHLCTSSDEESLELDYFGVNFKCKTVVWTTANCIHFALFFYLIFDKPYNICPITKFVYNKNIKMIDRIEVCRNMLTLFEYDGSLKKEAIDSLHKLKEFVSKESTPYNDCLPQNYELLNNKMKEFKSLGSSKLAARTYLNTKQINEFLQDKMREYELFKLDSELVGKGITQRYQFKHIRKVDDNSLASIAGFISNRIFEITREYITDNFTKVHVGYNKEGVNLLLEKLRESNYATCNFSYANDTAFYISENRGENFDRLKETLKKVKISYDWNNPHVFMKDKLNHIFVVVDKIRIDMLDDDTTAKFLERRKVEDNTYKIDEIILNYDSAFEYIKLHYVQDFLSVSIFTTISKDSGFIVEN